MLAETLRSSEDRSINIVTPTSDGGAIESRFVQRQDDTIILYLSSSSGCDRACRFCHLTQTGQTMMTHVTVAEYLDQAKALFDLLSQEDKLDGASIVHFNFMARGDALMNPHFINNTNTVIDKLAQLASKYSLEPKFKISTIFPTNNLFGEDSSDLKHWVVETLALHPNVEIYYSLYSLDPLFRKRWIPKAIDPIIVGRAFAGTINRLRIHHALIENENMFSQDIRSISGWLRRFDIQCHFNIIRYNPFGPSSGTEAPEVVMNLYKDLVSEIREVTSVQIVSRVGMDVKASCGTFIA